MLPIYGIIGAALAVAGLIYLYVFFRYLVQNRDSAELILAVSESLITVAIGAFYIYSVIVKSKNDEILAANFTNNIDDILVHTDSFEYYFTTKKLETTTEYHEEIENNINTQYTESMSEITSDSLVDVSDTTWTTTEENLYTESAHITNSTSQKTTLPLEINKTEQFIKNYQTFIQEIIKQKLSNTSIFNQTLANMKFGPPKIKTARDIKLEPHENTCFYNFFLDNALLLYSFTHCLLSLLSNTVQCSKCIKLEDEAKEETQSSESRCESKNTDVLDISDSEKNDISAPVGPLFESEKSDSTNNGPDLKLFQAKTTSTKSSSVVRKTVHNIPQNTEKYKLISIIVLTWTLPIIAVTILYFSSKTEAVMSNYENNIKVKSNFTISPFESNALSLVPNSANVTMNSTEVDNVVNRIYNIVNEVREKVTKKTTYLTPMMVDVVYFMSPKPRDSIETNICSAMKVYVKVLYFIIFIVGYCVVIMYAKVTETYARMKMSEKAQQQNVCMLIFSLLWLPSILDLFYRMFVSQMDSTVVSDIFLALGNSNRVHTMAINHLSVKRYVKKSNFVNPS